jgi:hypothetical protein
MMRLETRVARAVVACGLVLTMAGIGTGCSAPWRDTYFKKGVSHLSQDEVREKLGPPHTAKTPALGGDSVWSYRFALSDKDLDPWNPAFIADASQSVSALMSKNQEGPKATLYCYRYTLVFNEEKVLKSWKRDECTPGTRDTLTAK